jgi:hypothetical protein
MMVVVVVVVVERSAFEISTPSSTVCTRRLRSSSLVWADLGRAPGRAAVKPPVRRAGRWSPGVDEQQSSRPAHRTGLAVRALVALAPSARTYTVEPEI